MFSPVGLVFERLWTMCSITHDLTLFHGHQPKENLVWLQNDMSFGIETWFMLLSFKLFGLIDVDIWISCLLLLLCLPVLFIVIMPLWFVLIMMLSIHMHVLCWSIMTWHDIEIYKHKSKEHDIDVHGHTHVSYLWYINCIDTIIALHLHMASDV